MPGEVAGWWDQRVLPVVASSATMNPLRVVMYRTSCTPDGVFTFVKTIGSPSIVSGSPTWNSCCKPPTLACVICVSSVLLPPWRESPPNCSQSYLATTSCDVDSAPAPRSFEPRVTPQSTAPIAVITNAMAAQPDRPRTQAR